MLDVLAVLSDQGGCKLLELLTKEGNELCADKVLDRLLLFGLGEDVDVEL